MTPKTFFRKFVDLYREAREPTFRTAGVHRSRCRSVSGGLEDLTAAYIARNNPGAYRIFVDHSVPIGDGKVRYPDLVVCEKQTQVVRSYVDVKVDLGWKRDRIEAMCEELRNVAVATAGKEMKLGPNPKTRKLYRVVEDPSCHLVVGALANGGDTTPEKAAEMAREYRVEFYVLSEGKHPNEFSRQRGCTFDGLEIRQPDMKRLRNI